MENEAPPEQPSPSPAQPGQTQRVMDVVAPPLQTPEEAAETAQNNQAEPSPSVAEAAQQMAAAKNAAKPNTKSGNDTTVAIVATMVIVIVLAVLATYAFLKQ